MESPGSKDSLNEGNPLDIYIGRLSLHSRKRDEDERSQEYSETESVLSSPLARKQMTTYINRKQLSPELSLNSEDCLSDVMLLSIGTRPVKTLNLEGSMISRRMLSYVIMGTCNGFLKTIRDHLKEKSELIFIGDDQELVSHSGQGWKLEIRALVNVQTPNFGTDTAVRDLLSWMNSEGVYKSHIYYGGWTRILVVLMLKEALCLCTQSLFGSPQMQIPRPGTPILTQKRPKLY